MANAATPPKTIQPALVASSSFEFLRARMKVITPIAAIIRPPYWSSDQRNEIRVEGSVIIRPFLSFGRERIHRSKLSRPLFKSAP